MGRAKWKVTVNGYRVSFLSNENVLKLDSGCFMKRPCVQNGSPNAEGAKRPKNNTDKSRLSF